MTKQNTTEYYSRGYCIREISNKLNVDNINVYNDVASGNKITTSEERSKMISLYNKGYSISMISKIMNRSRSCIRERIKSQAKINCRCSILSDDQIKLMIDMFNNGASVASIAKHLCISKGSVRYRLNHCGIKRSKYNITPVEIERFIELHNLGKTYDEIAIICNRSAHAIGNHLRNAGYGRNKK